MDICAMEQRLEAIVAQKQVPGAAVCMMGPQGEVYARGFGVRGPQGDAADADTVFGVASMSKSMTALALCLLECEGRLNMDDPVAKYLPEFRVPGVAQRMVTIRHLCMHRGGLPPMEPLEWSIACNSPGRDGEWIRRMRAAAPNDMRTIDQVMDYIANCPYPTLGMPGEYMSYSNEGYAVLCYVADVAAGEPLEEYVQRQIFDPLGMRRSVMEDTCSRARELAQGNIQWLYEWDENHNLVCDNTWSVMPPYRGCATVKSTARDMAAYYRCLSNYGMHNGVQVWPRAAVERMVGAEFPLEKRPYYCLGLNKRAYGDAVICEHSGGLHGISSHGGLLLGQGWGFAVLTNLGETDVEDMVHAMMNTALGLPADKSHGWSQPAEYGFDAPEMLAGCYVGHEGDPVRLQVCAQADGIAVYKDGRAMQAVYCGGTLFHLLENGALTARAEFLLRDGRAWGVRYGSRVFGREDV